RYVVLTLTTGSSMRGYSRTDRRWYEMRPTSRMMSDSTVANTGRLMHSSGRVIARTPGQLFGGRAGIALALTAAFAGVIGNTLPPSFCDALDTGAGGAALPDLSS